jgi:hypothetical protein
MNRCVAVHGAELLRIDVASVKDRGFPNAAGMWLENHRGDYVIGGIAVDATDINSVDAVAESLRGTYSERDKYSLNLTYVNEQRRQAGIPYICEGQLPHTI